MKKLFLLIICVFFLSITSPSLAQAVDCLCFLHPPAYEVSTPNACRSETAYCETDGQCRCITDIPNTCGTNNTGTMTYNNCKGSTLNPCIRIISGGYHQCECLSVCPTPTPSVATCQCALNGDNRWYVEPNNCGSMNPSGCEGSATGNPSAKCVCKPVPTSPLLDVNKCLCSSTGVLKSNCQGSTPRASCFWVPVGTGFFDCKCDPGFEVIPTPYKPDSYLCDDGVSVDTALGCVPVEMDKFVTWLLPILFSISGGIAFLLMVYGFILITTSNGDPKAVQGARETITSAIVGLLISIFAIFILRLIAVDILHIPGIS